MDKKVTISNIQRFSLHDGPGIRTTIFFKGCSLHCPWCSNPENINPKKEAYFDSGEEYYYGKEMSFDEIFEECIKDKVFYGNDGGVTFSGGEPLLNISNYESLLQKFKNEKISLCVETALFVTSKSIELALQYFDYYCVDIKILNAKKCKEIIGGDIELYKRNVQLLLKNEKRIQFRFPLISPFTTEPMNIKAIVDFCIENNIDNIELIKGHNLAEKKYKTLGKQMYLVPDVSGLELANMQNCFSDNGIKTKLCII